VNHLLNRRTAQGRPTRTPEIRPPRAGAVIAQARVDSPTRWSVNGVLSAIDAHEFGDFAQSALLADAMGRDDRISGCMRTRENALIGSNGVDFELVPEKGADALAKRVESWWWNTLPDEGLRQIMTDIVLMGVHISRVHWDLTEKEWRPKRLERWHLSNVYWSDDDECFYARTADDEEEVRADDPNWLVITPGGTRSWMSGAVRALGLAYVMRQFNWRDWARFNERHGLPIIAIDEPASADENQRKKFYSQLRTMGSTGIIRLPQHIQGHGYKLNIIEAKDGAHASFNQFRKDLDIAIAVTLLGQNLTSEATGGSLALGRVHDRVRQDYLEGDAEGLSTALRAQLILPWGRFNEAAWDDDKAPWPTWHTALPLDRKDEAEVLEKFSKAVGSLLKAEAPVDWSELFKRVGVPVLKGADFTQMKAPPDPAPPGSGGDQGDGGEGGGDGEDKAQQRARLRSGANLKGNEGFFNGQFYADDLVDENRKHGAKASNAFLEDILAIVDEGATYDTIRDAVLLHYRHAAPPAELREILQKTLVLAGLAGQRAVLEDT
jgi:phage gp29-like protein